MKILRRFCGP